MGLAQLLLVSQWQWADRKKKANLSYPLDKWRIYTESFCCWLAASALCVVNKVLLFKHVQAWLFSFPLHIASGSLGLVLGAVQSEKHQRMLVLMPAA